MSPLSVKLTADERLHRKRLAARNRQRRCRERKKQQQRQDTVSKHPEENQIRESLEEIPKTMDTMCRSDVTSSFSQIRNSVTPNSFQVPSSIDRKVSSPPRGSNSTLVTSRSLSPRNQNNNIIWAPMNYFHGVHSAQPLHYVPLADYHRGHCQQITDILHSDTHQKPTFSSNKKLPQVVSFTSLCDHPDVESNSPLASPVNSSEWSDIEAAETILSLKHRVISPVVKTPNTERRQPNVRHWTQEETNLLSIPNFSSDVPLDARRFLP